MSMRRALPLGLLLAAVFLASSATAAVPRLLSYQGILADAAGVPLEGTHTLVFTVYRDSLETVPVLWTESHGHVTVHEGLFNVILGRFTPITDSLFSAQRWLTIRVDGGAEMAPRLRLTASAYALRAAVADSVVGGVGGDDGDWTVSGDDMSAAVSGKVGIGTASPEATLDIYRPMGFDAVSTLRLTTAYMVNMLPAWAAIQFERNSLDAYGPSGDISLRLNDNSTGNVYLAAGGGNVGIGTRTPGAKLEVAGTARVDVLEIAGADLAEKFPMSEPAGPGTVVVIDPQRPGYLAPSRLPYDRRLAGVVSGANGLSAGAVLGQCTPEPGAQAVAMSGRVWALCDATDAAIAPGDLLTTSSRPGHAMKADDAARSHGAVLGKAMSNLARGQVGYVLVLVNLQ